MPSELETLIAKSIKRADSSYFFENYSKQAKAVLKALEREGYRVVPKLATERQIEAGKNAISRGRVRPADFVHTIYAVMVAAGDEG